MRKSTLRRKFLTPMLAIGLAVAIVGLWAIQHSVTSLFQAQLAARGQILATAVNHVLLTTHGEAELRLLLRNIIQDEANIRAAGIILDAEGKGADVIVVAARPGQEDHAARIRQGIQKVDWGKAHAGHWLSNGDFEIARRIQLNHYRLMPVELGECFSMY